MKIAAKLKKLGFATLVLTCSTAFANAGLASYLGRAPVPTREVRQEALNELKDTFRAKYKAHDLDSRRELASELVRASATYRGGSLGDYYAYLDEARKMASEVQAIETGFTAIDLMNEAFEVDGRMLKVSFVKKIAGDVRVDERCGVLSEALPLIEECVELEEYRAARRLIDSLGAFAKSCKDDEVEAAVARANFVCVEFEKIEHHFRKLKSDPDHARANDRVGRFYCFVRADFETGLPHLAKSEDKKLKSLAVADLAMRGDPEEQFSLGEKWLDHAKGCKKENERTVSASRAAHWFERSLQGEISDRLRHKAEQRLETALKSAVRAPVAMPKPATRRSSSPGSGRSGEEAKAALMKEAADLRAEYEEKVEAARQRLLAGMDKVINKTKGKLKRKPAEVQAEALNPLLADREGVSDSDSSIPESPEFGSVATAYEKDSAAVRAKHRKRVMRVVRKLHNANLDDAAEDVALQLESTCPKTITCEVFSQSMEGIVATYRRDVIERQIATQAIGIRDTLFALHGKAQAKSISAVDLISQAKGLRLAIIDSTPYKVGNTKEAKGGQIKAYGLFKELEERLDEVLLKAK